MLDRHSDRALYQQLADVLRAKITTGELPPGSRLPSESDMAALHGLGRDAVRQALAVLRGEGLVATERGRLSMVRKLPRIHAVAASGHAVVTARMPTPEERTKLGLPEGVPILVIRTGQAEVLYGADRTEVRYGCS